MGNGGLIKKNHLKVFCIHFESHRDPNDTHICANMKSVVFIIYPTKSEFMNYNWRQPYEIVYKIWISHSFELLIQNLFFGNI